MFCQSFVAVVLFFILSSFYIVQGLQTAPRQHSQLQGRSLSEFHNCGAALLQPHRPQRNLFSTTPQSPSLNFHHASRKESTTLLCMATNHHQASMMMLSSLTSSSFLVRIVYLRAVAFVHSVAFLVAWRQNRALIGDTGITPARTILDRAHERGQQKKERRLQWRKQLQKQAEPLTFRNLEQSLLQWISRKVDQHPRWIRVRELLWDRSDAVGRPLITLLWFARNRSKLNPWLDGVAITGLAASMAILILGAANVPLVLCLWICQRSLMAVGGPWYGFGWEPQLAELSFHTLFLVPLFSLSQFPAFPVPATVQWTIRWMLFRVVMGAGLIKVSRNGDPKWKNLTAMHYFYETQPVPNPLTRYFHWMPKTWHKFEVLSNHFVELVAPWLLVVPGLPAKWRRMGGAIQILFQMVLISSGNLSFLNWLTIVPAIMCFDDAMLSRYVSPAIRDRAKHAAMTYNSLSLGQSIISLAFLLFVLRLSVPVIRNMLSQKQKMNSSFDPLRLVNTYGAFGSVNEVRQELVVSSAASWDGDWKEYSFKVKPGNVNGRPSFFSPYHYRLDWQMWIAACIQHIDRSPWMYAFLKKLLLQDPDSLNLMHDDPWKGTNEKPKYIRVDLYHYKFHRQQEGESNPPYWDREFVRRFYPMRGLASVETLESEIK